MRKATLCARKNVIPQKEHYEKETLLVWSVAAALTMMSMNSCSDENSNPQEPDNPMESDAKYFGQAVGNFKAEEWLPGGELGTTENVSSNCYEDETPAVTNQGFTARFNQGDLMASTPYTLSNEPYKGWGPCASRRACEYCHAGGYAHGHSRSDFKPVMGNGYIVSVYYPDAPGSNNGEPIDQLTTFTMTMADTPFLPPLDPDKVSIKWKDVTSMPSGLAMRFPDGEAFSLHYPEVSIPQDAFNVDPQPTNYAVRLIASCNFQGLGLIDALSNEDIEAQYKAESEYTELNPEFWDNNAKN